MEQPFAGSLRYRVCRLNAAPRRQEETKMGGCLLTYLIDKVMDSISSPEPRASR
jgi:hypothetical protein